MSQEKEVQLYTGKSSYTMADKVKAYGKALAVPVATTGLMLYSQGALADEVNYTKLADDAKDNMQNSYKAVLSVLGVGITIVGALKGYSYLKMGVRRA